MAYYTVEQRRKAVEAVKLGASISAVARHMGADKEHVSKWCKEPEKWCVDKSAEAIALAFGKQDGVAPKSAAPSFANGPEIPDSSSSQGMLDSSRGIDIALIGDMQVRPGIDLDYCRWVGEYIAENRPNVIVNIGDFADMPSCSFWEKEGSKSYAEQNYRDDILSVHHAMKLLMAPIQREMAKGWQPRLVMCLGNHEDRINRAIEAAPKLDGTIGLPDLEYERWGWEVHPFLQQVEIEGVTFAHYFPSGQMGRPISSARAMLTKLHTSAVAGHQQGRDIAFGKRANGKHITALICGSTYVHDEKYLNPQTNNHWRGMYMLNDVRDGEFEEKAVSMRYLQRRYS